MDEPNQSNSACEILFEEGIIGVPRARRFHLMERDGSPVRVMRCLDIEGFTLPVVDPRLADPSYAPRINKRVAATLGAGSDEPLLLLAVATWQPNGAVANLRAPLVINTNRRVAAQVILEDRTLPLRARIGALTKQAG